jgi:hypothetical protein
MPSRRAYEGLEIDQANHNPVAAAQAAASAVLDELKEVEDFTPDQQRRFDAAKAALPLVAGLEAATPAELQEMLRSIRRGVESGELAPDEFEVPDEGEEPLVSGDEIFVNQKVLDLVTKAEIERLDYRDELEQNVFFGTRRTYQIPWMVVAPERGGAEATGPDGGAGRDDEGRAGTVSLPTRALDAAVLVCFIAAALGGLYLSLRRTLTRVA